MSEIKSFDDEVDALLQEWDSKGEQTPSSPTLSDEEATQLGFLKEEPQEVEQPQIETPTVEQEGEDRYQKLGFWNSQKDMAKAVGVEASHFFMPKDKEWQYESKTHYAENMKYLYRYGVGTAAFLLGGEAVAGIKALGYLGNGAKALFAGGKLIKTGANATKAAKIGATVVNGAISGAGAGALADFTLYRPEENEGHLADAFGDKLDGTFLEFLQTQEDDSEFEARLKNVLDGIAVGLPVGVAAEFTLTPLVERYFRNLHKLSNAKTPKEADDAANGALDAQNKITAKSQTMDLIENIKALKTQADETGEELDQLIIDNIPANQQPNARAIGREINKGEDIFPYEDGTWAIKVTNSWEDAYKVSPEEYKRQLRETDPSGNLDIKHMNDSVRDTWTQRNLLSITDDTLFDIASKKDIVKGNQNTKNIVNYYKQKFGLEGTSIDVQFGHWDSVSEGKTSGTKKKILIQIDKQAPDIYSTLRSELEHARDIVTKTKPKDSDVKGSGTHFARYVGDNEAEIASGYVHKKSTNRAKAVELEQYQPIAKEVLDDYQITTYKDTDFGENPDITDADYQPYTIHSIKDSQGQNLAHMRITEGNYIQWRENHDIEKGAARKLIAKVLYEGQYPNLIWEATTDSSVKSYERFIREFPDLVDRIEFIDNSPSTRYNREKGDMSNGSSGNPNHTLRTDSGVLGTENVSTNPIKTGADSQKGGESIPLNEGNIPQGDTRVNERGEISNIDSPINSVTSTDDVITNLTSGKIELNSVEGIEQLLVKTIEVDPELSGKTFKDVAEDAESFFNKKINEGSPEEAISFINNLSIQKAEVIDQIVREQLACTKVIGLLKDQLDIADPSMYRNILTAMKNLTKYNEEISSAFGRALNYQKINKEALETFGLGGLSDATKMGIYTMTDILDQIGKETANFTRNTPLEIKKMFYQALELNEPKAYQQLIQDKAFIKRIDKELDEVIREKETYSPRAFMKKIEEILSEEEVERCAWYIKLCDDAKQAMDVISKFSRATTAYMINNVLGATSLTKSIVSGAVQGIAFPTTKIMGGVLTGNFDISKEGARTLLCGLTNLGEAMRAAKVAFKTGDGLMTNTKELVEGAMEKGFHEWELSWDEKLISLQNLHSFFPRLMMASDELMTQLNYRATMRAKAMGMADNELQLGKITEAEYAETVDKHFKNIAVDDIGRPLDFKTYAECKDMLFQLPLDRKLHNPLTGKREQVDTTSLMLKGGAVGQGIVERIPPLRTLFLFIKTPVNIADSVLKSNPLYMALSPDFRAKFTAKDPMVRAKARGQLAGSVLLYTGGIIAASQNLITGSAPIDQREKTALLRTGWQPKSIKLGDKYYSYEGLAPYDSILSLCADYVSLAGKVQDKQHSLAWDNVFAQAIAQTLSNTIDQAGFRTNSAKLLDLLNPSLDVSKKETILASIAGGLLPASANVRDLQTILNGGKKPLLEAETFTDKLLKNYIPMFLEADYQRDVFGRRMDIHNLLITKATDEDFNTPEYQEIARLANYGWTPTVIKDIVSETQLPLSEFKDKKTGRSAYDALGETLYNVKLDGLTLRQAVAQLALSEDYQCLPVGVNNGNGEDWSKVPFETKVKKMAAVFKEYLDEAKNLVLTDSNKYINSKGETMSQAKDRIYYETELKADSIKQLGNLY